MMECIDKFIEYQSVARGEFLEWEERRQQREEELEAKQRREEREHELRLFQLLAGSYSHLIHPATILPPPPPGGNLSSSPLNIMLPYNT